jgi:hypothetical protein
MTERIPDSAARSAGVAGYAMLAVMVFVSMSSMLLSSAYARMHQLFVFEKSSDTIASSSDGTEEALGMAIARFQTGIPNVDASDQFLCDMKLRRIDGSVAVFRITYKKLADDQWWVRARPQIVPLPACPVTFSDNACPAPPP